jgi:hypothetical protein
MYAAGLLMGPGALECYRYVPRRSARPPCACSCDCQLQQTMPSSALPHPCRRRPAGTSCAFVTTRCCSCTGGYLPCHHGYVAYDHQKRRRARVSIETLRPLLCALPAHLAGLHAGLLHAAAAAEAEAEAGSCWILPVASSIRTSLHSLLIRQLDYHGEVLTVIVVASCTMAVRLYSRRIKARFGSNTVCSLQLGRAHCHCSSGTSMISS